MAKNLENKDICELDVCVRFVQISVSDLKVFNAGAVLRILLLNTEYSKKPLKKYHIMPLIGCVWAIDMIFLRKTLRVGRFSMFFVVVFL